MFVKRTLRISAKQQRTKIGTISSVLWNSTSNSSCALTSCFGHIDRKWNSHRAAVRPNLFERCSEFQKRGFSTTNSVLEQKKNSLPAAPVSEDGLLPPKNLGIIARFKAMYKQYWYVLVPVHVVTSTGWLLGFYYLSKRYDAHSII